MKKGFTLVELVIVIVIVGILSIVAVPIYSGYVEKAKMTEGVALAGAIKQADSIYYAQYGAHYKTAGVRDGFSYDDTLGIDARSNTYYKYFYVDWDGGDIYDIWTYTGNGNDLFIGITTILSTGKARRMTFNPKEGSYEFLDK